MSFCYLCNTHLSGDNISIEHIIPNSIGGRLKSSELLCKKCNNKTGELYDSVFAKIGNVLASRYNIKKDKGIVPNFIATEVPSNKKIIVKPGSVTYYLLPEVIHENEHTVIHAYSKERLMQEIEKLQKELTKEKIVLEQISFEEIYHYDSKDFVYESILEPALFFRAICKIMVNFYVFNTKENKSVERAIDFLRNDIANDFSWFLDLNISKYIHESKPYHILIIKGSKLQKALYGYFELFGGKGYVTLLNGQYAGPEIQLNYTFDPINITEIPYEYSFKLNVTELIQLIHAKPNLDIIHDY